MALKSTSVLDSNKIIRRFNRAANSYDKFAILPQQVGLRMIQRLDLVRIQPLTILDLGCGTGFFTPYLKKCYPKAKIINIDIAANMLVKAKKKAGWRNKPFSICATAEKLPLKTHSIDLVFSNQMFTWCSDLRGAFGEIKRILKPGGLLMFTTLGPDTLKELRFAWQQIDTYPHVHSFADMHDIGDIMVQTRLADPVMDMEYFTLTYSNARQLLQELKALGASNAILESRQTLTGKNRIKQCLYHYEQFRTEQDLIPATFEVIYGHAWQPMMIKNESEVTIPIHHIKRIDSNNL